jgi:predicted nucleic acid-binding protein
MKLVDTSAWVEYLRHGQGEAADQVEALVLADEAAWCDMVLLELWNGARGPEEKRKLKALSDIVPRLETTPDVWELAHRLAAVCRDHGQIVPAPDLLVAACAVHHRVGLAHQDGHFEMIMPLAKGL